MPTAPAAGARRGGGLRQICGGRAWVSGRRRATVCPTAPLPHRPPRTQSPSAPAVRTCSAVRLTSAMPPPRRFPHRAEQPRPAPRPRAAIGRPLPACPHRLVYMHVLHVRPPPPFPTHCSKASGHSSPSPPHPTSLRSPLVAHQPFPDLIGPHTRLSWLPDTPPPPFPTQSCGDFSRLAFSLSPLDTRLPLSQNHWSTCTSVSITTGLERHGTTRNPAHCSHQTAHLSRPSTSSLATPADPPRATGPTARRSRSSKPTPYLPPSSLHTHQ